MKKHVVLMAILMVICLFSLSSCGLLADSKENIQLAKTTIQDFCKALSEDDDITAIKLFHPDTRPLTMYDLYMAIQELERQKFVDFSDGITLERCMGFNIALYTSEYDGMAAEYTYKVKIGNQSATMKFLFVKNDAGYGIYSFGM